MAGLYILNQIIDMKSDVLNQKHLLLAEGIMPVRRSVWLMLIFFIAAALLSLRLPSLTRLYMAVSFALGIIYSLPPFILKARPFLDFSVNGIGFGFFNFAMGWLSVRPYAPEVFSMALPYVFAVSALFINTTILDIEGDRKCRYLTTGVLLKERGAAILALVLIILSGIAAWLVRDWICLIPVAAALPLFILAAIRGRLSHITASIRIGGPLLILVVGLVFPFYLAVVLLIFAFLRFYYKKQFGITYPAL